jgi:hypothetical protein
VGRSARAPLAVSTKTPVAAGVLEGVDLELGLLVGGGDAGIAEQVSHAAERRTTVWQRWLCDVDFGHGFWTPGEPLKGCLLGLLHIRSFEDSSSASSRRMNQMRLRVGWMPGWSGEAGVRR